LGEPAFGLAVVSGGEGGAGGAAGELLFAVVFGLLLGSEFAGLLADVEGHRHEHAGEVWVRRVYFCVRWHSCRPGRRLQIPFLL
jgi:hypothetical protein